MGSTPIRTYGLLVGAALIVGMAIAVRTGRRYGVESIRMLDVGAAAILGGVIGARLLFVAVNFGDFVQDPWALLRVYEGGSVLFGGILGGLVSGLAMAHWRAIPLWRALDAAAPGVAGGMVIGRLGCLAHGCCYGRASELPWAVELHGAFRHPTQAYHSLEGFVLLLLVLFVSRRARRPGQTFLVFCLAAGVSRVLLELVRGDPLRGTVLGLSTSTLLGIALAAAAGATWVARHYAAPAPASP